VAKKKEQPECSAVARITVLRYIDIFDINRRHRVQVHLVSMPCRIPNVNISRLILSTFILTFFPYFYLLKIYNKRGFWLEVPIKVTSDYENVLFDANALSIS